MTGNRFSILLLFGFAAIGLTIALSPIIAGMFPFTFDQGRDFLWVKNQVDFVRPSLVGPWGSLAGVYFGPGWFWLLTIPYLISGGDPLVMTLFNSLVVFSAVIVGALLLKRDSKALAYFFLILGFWSPALHGIAGYSFSQHLLPVLTILLIYSYAQILKRSNRNYFIFSAFLIGVMFHAEPPTAIFSLPSLLLVFWQAPQRKKLLEFKTLSLGLIAWCLPFLPLLAFDLRHEFIQLKSLLAYFSGENTSLGGMLPLWQRIPDRLLGFFDIFRASVLQKPRIITFLLLLLSLWTNQKQLTGFLRKVWWASGIYVLSLLVVFTLYPPEFKGFYLDGLIIVFVLWAALAISVWWQKKNLKWLVVGYLGLVFLMNMSPFYFVNSVKNRFADKREKGNIFINQKEAVDWIYQDARGGGFRVYTYASPIYDYPYQYLFFWRGLNKYGYLPEEFSYLPNQPQYVEKKAEQLARLDGKIKPAPQDEFYLIIGEQEFYSDRLETWLSNFSNYKVVVEKDFPGDIKVEKRRQR